MKLNQNILNLSSISISNILQQILTILITFLLLKFYGAEQYSNYVILLSSVNLILLVINPSINPYLLREASKEYSKKNIIDNSFTITASFILIILFFFFITFNFLNQKFEFINQDYKYSLIYLFIALILINISKVISRITNKIKIYFYATLCEKAVFIILIIFFYFLFENKNITILIENFTIVFLSFSILIFYQLRSKIKINLDQNVLSYKKFYNSISYLYLSTLLFFFINQHYLILLINKTYNDSYMIASLGVAFLIVNMIYFPIYWFEQNYAHQYYKKIIKYDKIIFNNYFKKFAYFLSLITVSLSSIIILLIDILPVLDLFSPVFSDYKSIIISIILIIFSFLLDTILAIPVYAIKKEKYIFLSLFIRFILFYIFVYFKLEPTLLIFTYICLAYLQNIITLLILYFKFFFFNRYIFLFIFLFLFLNLLIFLNLFILFKITLILQLIISTILINNEKNNILKFLNE